MKPYIPISNIWIIVHDLDSAISAWQMLRRLTQDNYERELKTDYDEV